MRQLAFLLLIALAVVGVYGNISPKLVSGTSTSIQQYPHCAAMIHRNQYHCGGSIISPSHILTAGHCTKDVQPQNVKIITGTTYFNSGGQQHAVSWMWTHESYSPYRGDYDIGLIKIAAPMPFNSNQQPIRYSTGSLARGEMVTVPAWGSRGLGMAVHNDLQKIDAPYIPWNECNNMLQGRIKVFNTEFCTSTPRNKGLCHGDSGSGVVAQRTGMLVGMVSRGIPCAAGWPDVLTSVSPHVNWINSKMAL